MKAAHYIAIVIHLGYIAMWGYLFSVTHIGAIALGVGWSVYFGAKSLQAVRK